LSQWLYAGMSQAAFETGLLETEQHVKVEKNAVTWTRLACHRFAANAVRVQLHALAYFLANVP
jgi:hypothetical protein